MVCFLPETSAAPAFTVTMSGPVVGTQVGSPDANGIEHLTGTTVPVTLR
jgi:hypothetical protein